MTMRLVLPFGFYGAGNTGDEGTLTGFARLIAHANEQHASNGHDRIDVWSASRNAAHTARIEPAFRYFANDGFDPRRFIAKRRATALAVAGGTPIQDVLGNWPFSELTPHVRSVDQRRVPFAFIGVGIEDLRHESSRQTLVNEYASRVCHWSVRSERGRERLIEYGVSAERVSTAADMAWLIDAPSSVFGLAKLKAWGLDASRPIIAVNIANENAIFDRHPELLQTLATALDQLVDDEDAQVLFLCAETREGPEFDKAAALRLMPHLKRASSAVLAPSDYFSPLEMMSILSCCSLAVSMRYHFCLFSAMVGVPFIGIQRTDKVLDLCVDLGWTAIVVPPGFGADELIEHARRIARDRVALTALLRAQAVTMRTRALLNVVAIDALREVQNLSRFP